MTNPLAPIITYAYHAVWCSKYQTSGQGDRI